eukprot:TRINITY_DN44391_c0_g1_i1.p1 TRINITY_DN44391_c0_g1~~TRINITY_DN44391_c0_g1_i1.p1  ORF type:complete len:315 (-),score=34.86 TRINITY_DN44391_c0_g1_i1:146-1090(-)
MGMVEHLLVSHLLQPRFDKCVFFRARGEAAKQVVAGDSPVPITQVVLEDITEDRDSLCDVETRHRRLTMTVRHCRSANTGGFLWNCGRHLSKWLFTRRSCLVGQRVLELGCGLGLPSLVAACFAKQVLATDYESVLMETLRANAANAGLVTVKVDSPEKDTPNTYQFAAAVLDFTSASSVRAAGLGAWDMVLFTDCIYNAQAGMALPYAVRALLARDGVAIGVFPLETRPGIETFWMTAREAGLMWRDCTFGGDSEQCSCTIKGRCMSEDPCCRLFLFWLGSQCVDGDSGALLEDTIGEPENEVDEVEPLFSST